MVEVLIDEVSGGIATLTMNRPHTKNALDVELVERLGERFERLAEDESVRAIVLTGSGGAFCSGADLKAALADPEVMGQLDARIEGFHRVVRAVVAAPQPVIAMVDGGAVGFGCDLALACDLRLMSEGAYLQEKFVRIGLMPDGGGSLWLTRAVGVGRALELLLTGDIIDAARALELGLANRVCPLERLADETRALATRLAAGPPLAHAAIKRAVRAALDGGIDEALAREKAGQLRCLRSHDFMEGVTAWIQKREPVFRGE